MRDLYVVTHPEATHHLDGLVGGWFDSDLTLAGQQAAERIAARLRDLIPEETEVGVFSSDLRRTMQTAARISQVLATPVTATADLREKSYGAAEGREQSWLDARFVPVPATGERMEHDEGIEGSETKGQMTQRIFNAVDAILASPEEHLVVVTHGFAGTFAIARWIGIPLESCGYVNFGLSSGSISHLREDDFFHNRAVLRLNEVP